MEIRRCDKCNIDIDPTTIKDYLYWDSDDIVAIKIKLPFKTSNVPTPIADGLDDHDEFGGGKFKEREMDLCEACADKFSDLISEWFLIK